MDVLRQAFWRKKCPQHKEYIAAKVWFSVNGSRKVFNMLAPWKKVSPEKPSSLLFFLRGLNLALGQIFEMYREGG